MSLANEGRSRTAEEFVVKTGDLRLSVLSERILRVERSSDGVFTDEPHRLSWIVLSQNPSLPSRKAMIRSR